MTIAEAERFYSRDEKKYIADKNRELLLWIKEKISNGYSPFLGIDDIQETIDTLSNWYEFKYPERELKYYEGEIYTEFADTKKLSKNMDFRQLMYRLPNKSLNLVDCGYRSRGWGQMPIRNEKGEITGFNVEIFMTFGYKDNTRADRFYINADHKNGVIRNSYGLDKFLPNEKNKITLDEFALMLEKLDKENLDYSEINESVVNHNLDLELREKVLSLVALKLLYSDTTTPERGYERARRFISEFNKHVPGLSLSTSQIDEIMEIDYSSYNVNNNEDKDNDDKNKSSEKVFSLKKKIKSFFISKKQLEII